MNERRIKILEERRNLAHEGRNGVEYVNLCIELGVIPEDTILYQDGLDKLRLNEFFSKEKKIDKYNNFLRDVGNGIGLNPDLTANTDSKKRLLIKHFPGRFGRDGSQNLDDGNYDPAEIGTIYFALVNTARKNV